MLFGHYSPTSGIITINGQNADEVSLKSRQNNISLFTQQPKLFKGTVRENIIFGAKDPVDDARIWELAAQLGIDELLNKLPNKLDTDVGERGGALSGGEQQKIALLRGLMKNNNGIFLLDEITASLDRQSAHKVLTGLNQIPTVYATLMITHTLSDARDFATRIVVLGDHKVLAQGTHEELLNNCEFYQQLWIASTKEEHTADAIDASSSHSAMHSLMGGNKVNESGEALVEDMPMGVGGPLINPGNQIKINPHLDTDSSASPSI